MATSINSYLTTRNGMSGLVSGLDTDELVKGMTSATRTKMEKLLQQNQKYTWQMDAYRSVTTKLTAFQNKYMSFTSSSNIFSDKFFQNTTITALGNNSKYVSATGSSTSLSSLAITGISQVAKAASFTTSSAVSNNKISTGDLNFSSDGKAADNIAGKTLNIKYGNTTYDITFSSDLDSTDGAAVAQAFNDALAGIDLGGGETLANKISMSVNDGKFEIATTDSGDKSALSIAGASSTKMLSALGFSVGASASDGKIVAGSSFDTDNFKTTLNFSENIQGKTLTFTLNGLTKNIVFGDDVNYSSIDEFQTDLQSKLNSAFGTDRVKATVNGDKLDFQVMKTSDGTVDTSSKLTLSSTSTGIMGEDGILGVDNNTSNKLALTTSFATSNPLGLTFDAEGKGSLSVNGIDIEYSTKDSVKDIMNRINNSDAGITISYLETSDTFSIVADETGAHGKIDISDTTGNFAQTLFGGAIDVANGQDAIMTIKYEGMEEQTIIRSSNTFDVDGVNFTLAANAADFDPSEPITFDSKTNTDEMVSAIKQMAEDYNEIVTYINSMYSTKPDRDYQPLTDDQKADMSEKEIEKWEEQAKQGLLYGDSDMRTLASELRFVFFNNVVDSATFEEMGITTSSTYSDNGKISIDEDKLKQAIEKNIDQVKSAFVSTKESTGNSTDAGSGIMERLETLVNKYAKTSGAESSRGIFVIKAGVKDTVSATQSTLQKKIDQNLSKLDLLKETLKKQEDRYYSQFTTLEQYISKMNTQASWFTDQSS